MQFVQALHIKTPICARILISEDRLAVFTNYPSVTKEQALEETVLTLFHPVVHGCFQLVDDTTTEDTIARYSFSANCNRVIPIGFNFKSKILPFIDC